MIKSASALSLALLLCACGGGNKATKTDSANGDQPPAGETPIPATEGEQAKMAEPGTGGATAQPVASGDATPMTEADWEAAVVFSEKLADLVDSNKNDCDQMAGSIKILFDDSEALIAKANQWQQTATEEEQARFGEMYKDRLQAMGMKLGAGLQSCSQHAGVMEQFKRFE